MSSSGVNLQSFLIPLKEIKLATADFSHETQIGNGRLSMIYKGQLSKRWENRIVAIKRIKKGSKQGEQEFHNELQMISMFHHQSIIPFVGYCDESSEIIIVYEHVVSGSLDHCLKDEINRRCITWAQRLKICIGAARGLGYLHSGIGEGIPVIHRAVKSSNILLDDNLEAKICGFGLSQFSNIKQRNTRNNAKASGTRFYMDPINHGSGVVKIESDVYSFGVVLFEMLSGMLADSTRSIDDHKPQTLLNLVRRYYDDGVEKITDPCIINQINSQSFQMFKEVAYKCISFIVEDRPTMDVIIKKLEEALDVQALEQSRLCLFSQNHGATSTTIVQSYPYQNLERFLIPLTAINLATNELSKETRIGDDGNGSVYKGILSERWKNLTAAFKRFNPNRYQAAHKFHNEIGMMSSFDHENIIPFIGYCNEGNEMIIVSEYAENSTLAHHLYLYQRSRFITWEQRLKICRGAARGLKYLHSGLGEYNRVIHRDFNSAHILLDSNMEAKICGFEWSISVDRNQRQVTELAAVNTNSVYLDPIYSESGIVKTELDVYSFGIVLFEVLCGMLAYSKRRIGDDQPQTLLNLVRRYYNEGQDNLIDPQIRGEINTHSFHVIKEIAYRCISLNLKDRPTMNTIIKSIEEALDIQNHGAVSTITQPYQQSQNLERYLIPLKEITLATACFSSKTRIGDGGFGVVYRGQLSEHWKNFIVAIKRLDPQGHQGKNEFLTELNLISKFHHQNIIPFIGYCDEANEMIIVYEYANNRSLDYHLQDPNKRHCLTWVQRLKICLGAAKGLNYLHSGLGEDNRVIHRDIKSGNILLDENMEAKICDFGLSKESTRNQQRSHLYTNVAGTNFYMDPIYHESGILRKESDVYSFGVVMFELLSGMLAFYRKSFGDGKPQHLISLVRRYYKNGLEKLIDPFIRDEIDSRCFYTFKELAFQCISHKSEERPTMETIIERIEDALDFQELKRCKKRKT
ncbi:hypothetical protein Lser_V15G04237 [Lactuca serriola]